jgi:hypothetical protein
VGVGLGVLCGTSGLKKHSAVSTQHSAKSRPLKAKAIQPRIWVKIYLANQLAGVHNIPMFFSDLLYFLWSVISHWQSYATGGVVTGLIGVTERLSGKQLPRKVYALIFVASFLLAACFMAWREEFTRANRLDRDNTAQKASLVIVSRERDDVRKIADRVPGLEQQLKDKSGSTPHTATRSGGAQVTPRAIMGLEVATYQKDNQQHKMEFNVTLKNYGTAQTLVHSDAQFFIDNHSSPLEGTLAAMDYAPGEDHNTHGYLDFIPPDVYKKFLLGTTIMEVIVTAKYKPSADSPDTVYIFHGRLNPNNDKIDILKSGR